MRGQAQGREGARVLGLPPAPAPAPVLQYYQPSPAPAPAPPLPLPLPPTGGGRRALQRSAHVRILAQQVSARISGAGRRRGGQHREEAGDQHVLVARLTCLHFVS